MDPLRIALLSMHSCPWSQPGGRYTGGMNVYIRNLSRELGNLSLTIDIYTGSHADYGPCSFSGPCGNVNLTHIDTGSCEWTAASGQLCYADSFAQAVYSHCRELDLRYDIIHSHYWLSGLAGNRLKDLWQIPHMVMFHTLGALKNGTMPGMMEPSTRISHERSVIN